MTEFIKYKNVLKNIENSKLDIKKRELIKNDKSIIILYISQMTDINMLSEHIIKPITEYNNMFKYEIDSDYITKSIIMNCEYSLDNDEDKIIEYILSGMTVILIPDDNKYIIANLKNIKNRGVDLPELTFTLRGPRDCFNENLDVNLSLVRYRIKDPNLNVNVLEVGRRTKTRVAILHIGDIANDEIVKEVTRRITKIDVDGIVDSGELQSLLLNKGTDLFPQMSIIERSDMAASTLLDGKVVILVEGSALAICAPVVFSDFFRSCDDLLDNKYIAIVGKFIRMFAGLLSFTITALYVAIVDFHIDTMPAEFIISINNYNHGIPLSIFTSALVVELIIEMIREAMIRVPKQIGASIGVVGGIIIGQAAISSKLFSPIILVIVSISLMSSFTIPDYTITNALRVLKFFLIIVSSCFGLIGFVIAFSIIVINLVSNNSFGVPYFAPFAPFNYRDFKYTIINGKDTSSFRKGYLKTKDPKRANKMN
ncbi:MAG: spore germination protein [Clostridia bacterium]|nr:spore germination protein [Clostridia bacterium]